MDKQADSLFKEREIAFCTLHPDPNQAGSAAELLIETEGVVKVEASSGSRLQVVYHLLDVTLADIERLLEHHGFHLDNSIVHKVRRALYHYTEDAQRANMGCAKGESNCTDKVFANRYRKRDHGCQDDRPDHWRRYL